MIYTQTMSCTTLQMRNSYISATRRNITRSLHLVAYLKSLISVEGFTNMTAKYFAAIAFKMVPMQRHNIIQNPILMTKNLD